MYTFTSGAGEKRFQLIAEWRDEDGRLLASSGSAGYLQTYWSMTGGGTAYDRDKKKTTDHLDAFGCALNRMVTSVVGTTTTGRTAKAEVFDGFWAICIVPCERGENWVSLTATRADGSVAHRYQTVTPFQRSPSKRYGL